MPGLFILMAGNSTASDKPLDTREGFIEHFYRSTGRTDIEFGELKCASWWRPNIRMVDKFGEGRVFVAGGNIQSRLPFAFAHESCLQTQPTRIVPPAVKA